MPARIARSRWVSALNSAPSRIAMFVIHNQTRKMITVASEPYVLLYEPENAT